ncbi:MAG: nicotinate-nucleotide--dimethylbenzimidazole phosphoribosyltransferase [Acidimicrobiales bacterium]
MSPSASEGRGHFDRAAATIGSLDQAAAAEAVSHHRRLTKPRGSLGRLEDAGVRLAAMAGTCPPPLPEPATVAVFAADHGVHAEGVTPWPQEVTAQMVANFCVGGAAINVLARQAGARVVVVDVGVAGHLDPAPGLVDRKVRPGTANLAREPAMSVGEARLALDVGAQVAAEAVEAGARCLLTGDMGIANTTPSAALIAALTGRAPVEVTGRGTGVDDATLAHKVAVVEAGLGRAGADGTLDDAGVLDPLAVLASIGGLEIAALAGFVVGGAAARVPVLVDGVIALAGALVAQALAPGAVAYCVAGHRSTEPGAAAALAHLGLEPLLDLGLRLGEGTGACLALPLLQASARVLREMATFDGAGVTDKA